MAPKKIVIFVATVRPTRKSERVLIAVKNIALSHGMEVDVLDPLELPFELIKVPLYFMDDPQSAPEWFIEANNKIASADGFIIVSAEYNCGIPPPLGNMLDHFPHASFAHRPCGLVVYSTGPFGGIRATVVYHPFINELSMFSTPFSVIIPEVHLAIQEDGTPSERVAKNITKLVDEVGWYADAIKNQKKISHPPPQFPKKVKRSDSATYLPGTVIMVGKVHK